MCQNLNVKLGLSIFIFYLITTSTDLYNVHTTIEDLDIIPRSQSFFGSLHFYIFHLGRCSSLLDLHTSESPKTAAHLVVLASL